MRKKASLTLLAAIVAVILPAAALAADNWVGSWTLDPARSKADPGPLPKSRTLTFEAVKGGIKLSSTTVEADGKESAASYEASFDGSEAPWTGNPDADTTMPKRVDDNTYTNTWKKDGKVTLETTVKVSEDGKTLTVTQKGKTAAGKPVSAVHVYTRQ